MDDLYFVNAELEANEIQVMRLVHLIASIDKFLTVNENLHFYDVNIVENIVNDIVKK